MSYHRYLSYIILGILFFIFAILACTPITGSREYEFNPVCTPTNCAGNEDYVCHDECPGGCGTSCAIFTPAPQMDYTTVELVVM
jgi:hypothetical protein